MRHAVCRASDVPVDKPLALTVAGREILVVRVGERYFAMLDRCPHQGARLSAGCLTGMTSAARPGRYETSRPGEFLRCPWHGWEFDVTTGQSWFNPRRTRVPTYAAAVEHGADLVKGPYVAETFPVTLDEDYVVVELRPAGETRKETVA